MANILTQVQHLNHQAPVGIKPKLKPADGKGFAEALQRQLKSQDSSETLGAGLPLQFSHHAVERMHSRGISFTKDQIGKIEKAVRKAAQKGAKETLVIGDKAALIVSVKNNKVVTVMDKEALKENVFTKIDSTVFI